MMRSNPPSNDLTELIKERSFKEKCCCINIFSIMHYYCCYVPCSFIYND